MPGERFSELELSGRLDLARAATRAALMRLAEGGLVEPLPRLGFVVTPITLAGIRELFELRLLVEPRATAMAVGKLDPARLRRINRAPQKARSRAEKLAFTDSNRAFHREIAAATGNQRLQRLLESLADEMQRLVHLGLFGRSTSNDERRHADAQHEAVIEAFESGDTQAAEEAARLHVEHSEKLAMEAVGNEIRHGWDQGRTLSTRPERPERPTVSPGSSRDKPGNGTDPVRRSARTPSRNPRDHGKRRRR